MVETFKQMLAGHPFMAELPEEYVEKFLSLGALAKFKPDQLIFREGDISTLFYIIVSGSVSLEVTTPGRTLRIQTLTAGDELGWSSFLKAVGKQFQARCVEPVEAVAFDSARVLQACDEDPAFGYQIMRRILALVAERLQATRLQLLDMYSPKSSRETR